MMTVEDDLINEIEDLKRFRLKAKQYNLSRDSLNMVLTETKREIMNLKVKLKTLREMKGIKDEY